MTVLGIIAIFAIGWLVGAMTFLLHDAGGLDAFNAMTAEQQREHLDRASVWPWQLVRALWRGNPWVKR